MALTSVETYLSPGNEAADAGTVDRAAEAAKSDVDPISDHRASAEYRAEMTRVLVARAIRKALARAG